MVAAMPAHNRFFYGVRAGLLLVLVGNYQYFRCFLPGCIIFLTEILIVFPGRTFYPLSDCSSLAGRG
jgi:hypothetical protein